MCSDLNIHTSSSSTSFYHMLMLQVVLHNDLQVHGQHLHQQQVKQVQQTYNLVVTRLLSTSEKWSFPPNSEDLLKPFRFATEYGENMEILPNLSIFQYPDWNLFKMEGNFASSLLISTDLFQINTLHSDKYSNLLIFSRKSFWKPSECPPIYDNSDPSDLW